MAIREIKKGEKNKILRAVSQEVKKFDRGLKKLIADLIDTMKKEEGIGIAAPQIGVNLRVFIARLNPNTDQELILPMINPKISEISNEQEEHEEGCLSLRGKWGIVKRAKELRIEFFDQRGGKHCLNLEGLNARIIQHEISHLDGKLFIDSMEREIKHEKSPAAAAPSS